MRKALVDQIGLSARDANELINGVFDSVSEALERGEQVKLAGLGTFGLRKKQARPGRNPRTGEYAEVSARTVVTFKCSQKIRNHLRKHAVQ